LTEDTETLSFRTSAGNLNRCSPSEVSAFRNMPANATVNDLLAALSSDTCRQCALSDVNDNIWGMYIFRNTGGADGGGRTYETYVRPNTFFACLAQHGSQGCGRYILRRSLCLDNTCIECPTERAFDGCAEDVFGTNGVCKKAQDEFNWDDQCATADLNRAIATCDTLTNADILNQLCGTGTALSDGGTDSGSSDGGDGG